MKRQKSRKFALHNMKKSPFGMTLGAAFIDKFLLTMKSLYIAA